MMKEWLSNKWVRIGGAVVAVFLVCGVVLSVVAFALGPFGLRGFARPDRFGDRGAFQEGRGGARNESIEEAQFFGRGPAVFSGEAFGPHGFAGRGGFHKGRGGRGGVHGDVTDIGENSVTLETSSGVTMTATIDSDTRVWIVETQSEGSLSDVEEGDSVAIRGRRSNDDSVDARGIVLFPEGDRGGGRVVAVDENTITVEDLNGESEIVTNEETQFRLHGEEGSLADVSEDAFIIAFGERQEDGSLIARLVFVGRQGKRGQSSSNWF